jgi:hypothetical protein
MADVIEFALRSDAITTQGTAIAEKLGSYTVGTLPNNRFALAKLLETEPDPVPHAFERAGELLAFMREAELIGLPGAAPAVPAAPMTVHVVTPTRRQDMDLNQLIAELTAHPDESEEIIDLLRALDVVRQADAKLRGSGEWAIPNEDGALNPEQTIAYVRHLARRGTQPQRKWRDGDGNEYWPTTIGRAVGLDTRMLLYPFSDDPRELLLVGPDKFGNDWGRLSDDVHEAVIDAVASGKLIVRNETEVRRVTHELFGAELPAYLNDIVEDYVRGKSRGLRVERYATDEQLRRVGIDTGSRRPFDGSRDAFQPERDEAWYEAQLRALAGREVEVGSGVDNVSRCVVPYVRVTSGVVDLSYVIVLGNVTANSGIIRGTAYAMPGATIRANSGMVSREINRAASWKVLYDKAVEWGIIQS